jgi:hypothetical protein
MSFFLKYCKFSRLRGAVKEERASEVLAWKVTVEWSRASALSEGGKEWQQKLIS